MHGRNKTLPPISSFNIYVKMPTKTIQLMDIEPTASVSAVKDRIHSMEAVATDKMTLKYAGLVLTNNQTLADADVIADATLKCEVSTAFEITVFEVKTGKKITVGVEPNDTISIVKEKVEDKVAIPPEKQLLYLGDSKLEDGAKTLKDLDIKAGSELTLKHVIVKISINVEKFDGTRFEIEVKPEDTISTVKDKIFEKKGIAVEK